MKACTCSFCRGKRPHYVMYVTNAETGYDSVLIYYEHNAAHKLLLYIIGDDPYTIITPNHELEIFNDPVLVTGRGAFVRVNGLRGLLTYRPTIKEMGDTVNDDSLRDIARAVYAERRAPKAVEAPTPRTRRESRTRRAPRNGLTTAIQIAEELDMKPREFRGILRKLKVEKPDCGWAWPADQVDEIRALIQGAR